MSGSKQATASSIVAATLMSVATPASAGVISQALDTNGDGIPDTAQTTYMSSVTFDREGIPGQATNFVVGDVRVGDYAGVPAGQIVDPYLYHQETTNCLVDVPASTIPGTSIPVAECPQGTGPVALTYDNQTISQTVAAPGAYAGDYIGRFFSVDSSGSAGGDSAAAQVHIGGNNTTLTGYFEAGTGTRETQQLAFDVTGPSVPDYIAVDIDLSLTAGINGNLSGSPAGADATSQSLVQVIDLDSFQLTQSGGIAGSADMPFSALASVDGTIGQDAVNGTYTVLLRPKQELRSGPVLPTGLPHEPVVYDRQQRGFQQSGCHVQRFRRSHVQLEPELARRLARRRQSRFRPDDR